MPSSRREAARRRTERRRQRWVLAFAVAVLVVVAAIPAYGYFDTFIAPPRHTVVAVNDIDVSLGDVVKRTRANVATTVDLGAEVELSTMPFEVVNTLMEEELLRQSGTSAGIVVTQDDIDEKIRDNHYPDPPAGETADESALQSEFQESLRNYLNLTQFSMTEYRTMLKAQIIRERLQEKLKEEIPSVEEQVYAHWIKVINPDRAEEVIQRLEEGDAFDKLARIYSENDPHADDNGEVGWVPRGAFPFLDPTLFEIEQEKVSQPVTSGAGTYIVKVTDGPVTQEIGKEMRDVLKSRAVDQWINQQREANEVRVNFNNEEYAWVIDKTRELVPARTPVTQF